MFRNIAILVSIFLAPAASAQDASDYIGSTRCAACHVVEAAAWNGSDHQLAWTEPSAANVRADFDGTAFESDDISVTFSHDAMGYHATITEADGTTTTRDVHSVAGIEPLQQYLFEIAPGKLQSFDIVWDTERKRWYHLYPNQSLAPGDGMHWTGPYKNWNARCAECHATGYEKNYNPVTQTYQSIQAEIGVGCEACHGPGAKHLEWAETGRLAGASGLDRFGFTIPTGAGTEAWIQQCAGCHSRREAFGDGNPLPGTPYHDTYRLAMLTPDLYFPDGQIREEVYVYGSFLQSKMYASGVGCQNCHDPHSTRLLAEGNAVCTQCHSPAGNTDFPSLRLAEYDSPAHHFHAEGSAGAQCKNCHMVERAYMGIDERADHSFRIPRPDLAGATGAPDACTTCHDDQTPDWAARRIAGWYPDSTRRGAHFGTAFALAASDPAAAQPGLLGIAGDESQADLVRATALYLMAVQADAQVADDTAPYLADDSPLLRAAAIRLQRNADPQLRLQRLLPLLGDPLRVVRLAAVPDILNAPAAPPPAEVAAAIGRAANEWQQSLSNRLDFPEAHLILGGTALIMRNLPAAAGAFREAVTLDPQRAEAWVMLVRLEATLNGRDAAARVIAEGLAAIPGQPELEAMQAELGAQPVE
ncbi:MAG: multiheme c-type cytochrome [Paracoccus sp. (in: a-proteobacteria)]